MPQVAQVLEDKQKQVAACGFATHLCSLTFFRFSNKKETPHSLSQYYIYLRPFVQRKFEQQLSQAHMYTCKFLLRFVIQ